MVVVVAVVVVNAAAAVATPSLVVRKWFLRDVSSEVAGRSWTLRGRAREKGFSPAAARCECQLDVLGL